MRFLLELAWRDLRASGRTLWVFCACLMLGVSLIAATGGLYRQVTGGLLADTRALFGGDVEVSARAPLPPEAVDWMRADGRVSLLMELRTMLGTDDGEFQLVELQSVDAQYPLYGELILSPSMTLAAATAQIDGRWGAALDPVLASRLGLAPGATVQIGSLTVEVRALIQQQPDRSLSADWRGPPVLIAADALMAAGLIQPGSRVDYDYRVRTDLTPEAWRDRFVDAFPDSDWEVRGFSGRSERLARVLGQVASGLLLIGFSALFIGGLGVFNSIQAYLQGKLATIATLRALGLRDRRLAAVYLLQVGILGGGASLAGALIGGMLAIAGASLARQQLPVSAALVDLLAPLATALGFGVLTAFAFALPAVGRALSVSPAALFRGVRGALTATPPAYRLATMISAGLIALLVVLALPDALFGLGFVAVIALLLGLLDGIVHGLRTLARRVDDHPGLTGRFALRLALANLHRPGAPLRAALLSLGSALTLLVACTLVVAALLRAINDTIPEEAPALVFYDISSAQLADVSREVEAADSLQRLDLAPLVLGRLVAVNGERLGESADRRRAMAARDEHKLSDLGGNIDGVTVDRGAWPAVSSATPWVAMEDREADQLGLAVGDRLRFEIGGQALEAELAVIYRQRGMQTRFWFEALFPDGTLEPFITRYVGAAYLRDDQALAAQNRVAAVAPNVITVRTEAILTQARTLLGKASAGLGAVAAVSLAASALVLVSVMAGSRARQVYDATVLHALGARLAVIRRSVQIEYLLLAVVTSLFAIVLGSAVALPLLAYRIKLPIDGLIGWGAIVALGVSVFSLSLGARYFSRRLRLVPALLLRSAD